MGKSRNPAVARRLDLARNSSRPRLPVRAESLIGHGRGGCAPAFSLSPIPEGLTMPSLLRWMRETGRAARRPSRTVLGVELLEGRALPSTTSVVVTPPPSPAADLRQIFTLEHKLDQAQAAVVADEHDLHRDRA